MFTTILVPLDGSKHAECALPIAARIAKTSGATIVLARVVNFLSEYWPVMTTTAPPSPTAASVKADLEEATAYLERTASSEHLRDLAVKTIAYVGPVASTILSLAIFSGSDLIIVGSHGHPGMAEKIARHASMPVLMVREDQTRLGSSPADLAQPLRLLVPLDGSAEAQAALEPGVTLLAAIAAPDQQIALHLVRVISPRRGPHVDHPESSEASLLSHELVQAKQAMRQTVEQLREGQIAPAIAKQRLPITCSVVLDNNVAQALIRVAEQGEDTEDAGVVGGCELIALTNRGRAAFRSMVFGSITERLLHTSRRPILLVRPAESTRQEEPLGERRHQTVGSVVLP